MCGCLEFRADNTPNIARPHELVWHSRGDSLSLFCETHHSSVDETNRWLCLRKVLVERILGVTINSVSEILSTTSCVATVLPRRRRGVAATALQRRCGVAATPWQRQGNFRGQHFL